MHRYAEAVAAAQVPPSPGNGEERFCGPASNAWNKQAEDYAQLLMLRPRVCVDDLAVVIMLTAIEAVKTRRNAAPDSAPVLSVALGLTWGRGTPIDSTLTPHYEWTIRLLNRYMRQSVLGYDGVAANFRWTTIQLNAFRAKAHVDRTNTETRAQWSWPLATSRAGSSWYGKTAGTRPGPCLSNPMTTA